MNKEINELKNMIVNKSEAITDFETMFADPSKRREAILKYAGTSSEFKEHPESLNEYVEKMNNDEKYAEMIQGVTMRLIGRQIEKRNTEEMRKTFDKLL